MSLSTKTWRPDLLPVAVAVFASLATALPNPPAAAQVHGQNFVSGATDCSPGACAEVPSTCSDATFAGAAVYATTNRNPPGSAGVDFDRLLAHSSFEGAYLIGGGGDDEIDGVGFNALSIAIPPSCAQVHTASAGNIDLNVTYIDRMSLNGAPGAFLLVQEQVNTTAPTETLGVFYAGPVPGRWGVFNQDGSAMTAGRRFWILDGSCAHLLGGQLTIASCAVSSGLCYLQNPAMLDGRANAVILVTQRWVTPPGIYNPHPVGVRYDAAMQRWAIYNTDGTAIPANAGFFVGIVTAIFIDGFEDGFFLAWSTAVS